MVVVVSLLLFICVLSLLVVAVGILLLLLLLSLYLLGWSPRRRPACSSSARPAADNLQILYLKHLTFTIFTFYIQHLQFFSKIQCQPADDESLKQLKHT